MERQQQRSADTHRRLDLQGLRALAVALVVLEHVSDVPVGGFVGVDVFFVLSGFLITGGLLAEHRRSGRIALLSFAGRRVRRLMPAAVVVLLAGLFAAMLLLPARRAADAAVDAMWSFLSLANWHFAAKQTDYFASQAESPFQHFWSLSVEEQFYVVLPALLLLVLTVGGRRHGRVVACAVLTVLVLASFALALSITGSDPSSAYFSSAARAWELGVGSLLAFGVRLWADVPKMLGTALSWAGIVTIVLPALFIDGSALFPAPLAVLPVLGAALVIVGGAHSQTTGAVILRTRPVVALGDISYSLYLWHFPVLVIVTQVDDQLTWITYPLSIALAAVSFHLVERPLMTTPYASALRTISRRVEVRAAARKQLASWFRSLRKTTRLAATGALATCTAILVLVAADGARPIEALPLAADTAVGASQAGQPSEDRETADVDAAAVGSAVRALQTDLRAALAETRWPKLDEDPSGKVRGGSHLECGDVQNLAAPEKCSFGNAAAPKTMMLVGDSTAMHELDALIDVVGRHADWRLTNRSGFACSFMSIELGTGSPEACRAYKERTIEQIEATKPDVLLVTNSFGELPHRGTKRGLTTAEWAKATGETMDRVTKSVGKVLYITPPPVGGDIATCYDERKGPARCASRLSGVWPARLAAMQQLAEERDQQVLDTRALFCVDRLCPAFVGTSLVKTDAVHLSGAYALRMAPALDEMLVSAKVFD